MAESTTVAPFNAGEPYDYAKLNSLVNALNDIKKNIPGLGSAGVKGAIPVVLAGTTASLGSIGTANSIKSVAVNFEEGVFDSAPVSVVLTPKINNTKAKDGVVNYYVSDITKSGFNINYSTNNTFKASPGIAFNWVAVYMKPNA